MLQQGIVLSDRYEIIEKIGSGGMSDVYKAKCTKLNRYVAVKVLKDEFRLDDNFVSKFKIEAQSAASLSHQNIVNVYDVGNDKNVYYIIMEYVEGITLKDYILNKGPLSAEETIQLSIQIASGIEHAHTNHIIHRDIKPQNIIISNGGIAKVTDFGIARAASSATISAANVVGSVHYISPEQARGGYIDEKSDLYSLGITMYEMITGKVPFEGDSNLSVALLHIQERIKKPSLERPDIPSSLEAIILKATQKKNELRYSSMSELIVDLRKALKTPDGSFVTIPNVMDSETVFISDEDVKKLRSVSDEIEKEEKTKNSKNQSILEKMIVGSGILLAMILVGLISVFAINFLRDRYVPKEAIVPYIEGLNVEEAGLLLEEHNLILNIQRYEFSEEFEEGQIMKQIPEADTMIQVEGKVNVIVSKGVQTFKVPNVVNLRFNEAEKIVMEENLAPKRELEYSDSIPMGIVIRQYPDAGEQLRKDEPVIIIVSNGREPRLTTVPNLRGLTVDEADAKLKEFNLQLGGVSYVESTQYAEGLVISQTVQANTEVQQEYIIDIAVSSGYTRYYEKLVFLEDIFPPGVEEGIVRIELEQKGEVKTVYERALSYVELPVRVSIVGQEGEGTLYLYINDKKQGDYWRRFTFSEEEE